MSPQLTGISLGDSPGSWANAGFRVDETLDAGGSVQIGPLAIRLLGGISPDVAEGVLDWSFDAEIGRDNEIHSTIDGIAVQPARRKHMEPVTHPNGVNDVDHLVLSTPNRDRTLAALGELGIERRRSRQATMGDRPIEQTFLWMGSTICELISTPGEAGDAPATVWGLALVSADIDATVEHLGSAISPARTAVQPGRRIASLRHRDLGISLPVAIMTPHIPKRSSR